MYHYEAFLKAFFCCCCSIFHNVTVCLGHVTKLQIHLHNVICARSKLCIGDQTATIKIGDYTGEGRNSACVFGYIKIYMETKQPKKKTTFVKVQQDMNAN